MSKAAEKTNDWSKKRRLLKWVIVALGLASLVDAAVYEPLHPALTTYNVALPGLPKQLDGFRIVQLSDLHRGALVRDVHISRAVDLANRTHPDIATFTGDFVTHSASNAVPCCLDLSRLHTRLGSFAVLGNHDHWTNAAQVSAAIAEANIVLLDNSSVRLNNGLCLAGIDDEQSGSPNERAALAGIGGEKPCVLLAHSPLSAHRFKGRNGLLLVGHTHGAQINVPIASNAWLSIIHCRAYRAGMYSQGRLLMYVNRGVGLVFPPLRFLSRPEVSLFILHSTTASCPRAARAP